MHYGTPELDTNDFYWRVREALQDRDMERWTRGEILTYANAGAEAIVNRRPDAFASGVALPFNGKPYATLDEECRVLIRVDAGSKGRPPLDDDVDPYEYKAGPSGQDSRVYPVTQVNMVTLAAVDPNWSQARGEAYVHWGHAPGDPRQLFVYPPRAKRTTALDLVVAYWSGFSSYDDYEGQLHGEFPLSMGNALFHYVMFAALSRDAEEGNAALAKAHYDLYERELETVKLTWLASISPQ